MSKTADGERPVIFKCTRCDAEIYEGENCFFVGVPGCTPDEILCSDCCGHHVAEMEDLY